MLCWLLPPKRDHPFGEEALVVVAGREGEAILRAFERNAIGERAQPAVRIGGATADELPFRPQHFERDRDSLRRLPLRRVEDVCRDSCHQSTSFARRSAVI